MAVPFSDRELKKAWRYLDEAAHSLHSGSHPSLLLMFYAIECGLKCAWLKKNNKSLFGPNEIDQFGHDLHRLVKALRLSKDYGLPNQVSLAPYKKDGKDNPRHGSIDILHQAWRYGAPCQTPSNSEIAVTLGKINAWIRKELQ